ncbi:MAG: heparin lyase I family protein [Methylococcales bacterium]
MLPIRNTDDLIEIGFEHPDLLSNGLNHSGNPPQVVSDDAPVLEGNQSLSVFIDKNNSPDNFSSQITLREDLYSKKFTELEFGKDYWLGFAIYLNDDYQMQEYGDHVFILNSRPDKHLGEGNRAANIVLTVSGKQENNKRGLTEPHWVVAINGDDRQILPANDVIYATSESAALTPVAGDTGRWVSWVIHIKHTFNADGLVEIWKDGVQVYSKNGIHTSFNDARGPFVKLGSNKWSWKSDKYAAINPARRQSFLDGFRMAQGSNRLVDVDPIPDESLSNPVQPPLSILNVDTTDPVEEVIVKEEVTVEGVPEEEVSEEDVPEDEVVEDVPEEEVVEDVPEEEVSEEDVPEDEVVEEVAPEEEDVSEEEQEPNQSSRNTDNLIEIGFEQSDIFSLGLLASGNTPKVTSNKADVFEGKQALSVLIDRGGSRVPYRTEFTLGTAKYDKQFTHLEFNQEYSIGIAVKLSDDFEMPIQDDIFIQTHGRPDSGEKSRNPAISLRLIGESNYGKFGVDSPHWGISVNGDSKKITSGGYTSEHIASLSSAVEDKGRWVTFVIRFKNTYNKDGFIEIWKDGKKVHRKDGIATAFNDSEGPYIKAGSYKWSWRKKHNRTYATTKSARRLSHLDSFRVAKGENRIKDVSP